MESVTTYQTSYKLADKITKGEWLDTDFCDCGKQIFKYQDTTNNVFVMKCKLPYSKDSSDGNTSSKKQGCGMFKVYFGERPVYDFSSGTCKKDENNETNDLIFYKLDLLFKYVLVNQNINTHKTSLSVQYINYLVKNKLKRLTLGNHENKTETIQEYKDRIFSRVLIDKTIILKQKNQKNQRTNESHFIDLESESDSANDSESDNDSVESGSESDNESTKVESEFENDDYEEDYDYFSDNGGEYYSD